MRPISVWSWRHLWYWDCRLCDRGEGHGDFALALACNAGVAHLRQFHPEPIPHDLPPRPWPSDRARSWGGTCR